MNIHEYQGKELLRRYGVPVLDGHVATTPEEAEAVRFRGSPTILVNGQDPFADPDAPVGLSCRVYRTDAGLAGAPTVEQLLTVLR